MNFRLFMSLCLCSQYNLSCFVAQTTEKIRPVDVNIHVIVLFCLVDDTIFGERQTWGNGWTEKADRCVCVYCVMNGDLFEST